ncbi:RsmD family RNA methyltransferase [Paramicrobacterium agarici]|uniref:16S rRNA (Guanine966-N2)-methyltransferase n=1 Tax=Paramicrobacterium agarici TaxID=630514 RepID=A0A2A9DXL8_9MICO|nr:RsmD family RNA methyltransferase [Microbacterium agarici]PFG31547.1 16S rRNA (guanine966-N2)-methyltransferase [Microbacterium agarici]TQO21433.1 16S rRNA (guanine966-N2)-methyltransferase [Microbacterium agarici]
MTRIIGGDAGSLALKVPPQGTRPTSDRVREAIFSALDSRDALRGAHVADLYAGSGAQGLEAASRGAASVTLVDSSPRAGAVCRANASTVTRAAERSLHIETVVSAVQPWLDRVTHGIRYSLVFLDPPYDLSEDHLAANLSSLVPHLDSDATIVVERSSRSPEPSWPDAITPLRSRRYGETVVWWAEAAGQPAAPSHAV